MTRIKAFGHDYLSNCHLKLCVITILCSGLAVPAWGQTTSSTIDTVDELGIDLFSLQYTETDGDDVTIGTGDFPKRLAFTRLSVTGSGITSNLDTYIGASTSLISENYNITIVMGRIQRAFTSNGTAGPEGIKFMPSDLNGGYVLKTTESGITVFTYYSSQGDKIRFTVSNATVCGRYNYNAITCSRPSQWTAANGVFASFNYNVRNNLVGLYGETDTASITNSLGLSLSFVYTSFKDTGRYTKPQYGITSVTASSDQLGPCYAQVSCSRNTSYEYYPTPPIDPDVLSQTNIVLTKYTDVLGNSTQYVYNGQTTTHWPVLYSIRRPENPATDAIKLLRPGPSGNFSVVDAVSNTWTYARSVNSNNNYVTTIRTDPQNATRTYEFDAQGALVRFRNELANETRFSYYRGALIGIVLPSGIETTFNRDIRGNIAQTVLRTSAQGSGPIIVTQAQFEPTCSNPKTCNKPITTTDARGNVTNYDYDPTHGGIVAVTLPAATAGLSRPQTRYSYGVVSGAYVATSLSICRTTASCVGTSDETRVVLGYGTNGLLPTSQTVQSGDGTSQSSVSDTYDALGNLVIEDGPLLDSDDRTYARYDQMGRIIGTIRPDPDGAGPLPRTAERKTYNASGKLKKVEQGIVNGPSDTDWMGFSSQQSNDSTYDTSDRKILDVSAASGVTTAVTQVSYDPLSRIDCVAVRMNSATWGSLPPSACTLQTAGADPDRITKYGYDLGGRQTKITAGLGTPNQADIAVVSYTIDGQTASKSDANNNVTTYSYDNFGRLAKIAFPLPANSSGTSSATDYVQFAYDDGGNITSRRTRNGDLIGYSYDALNRMISKDMPGAAADVYYDYDLTGALRAARFASSGGGIVNTWDALGRLASTANTMGPATLTLGYKYDSAGNRLQITHPDGALIGYSYDALKRMRNATWTTQAGSTVPFLAIAYDAQGRRAQINRMSSFTGYGYDASSRLTAQTQLFAGAEDNASATFSYNLAGQIVNRSQSNSAYTFNGIYNVNRSYATNGLNQYTTAGPATFSYDANGNLIGDGTNNYSYDAENRLVGGSGGVSLSYDPLGRLWQLSAPWGTTRMLYDGNDLVAEYDGSGMLLRRHAFGPNSDEPILSDEGGGLNCGGTRVLHTDERGSVVASADCWGNRASVNSYDDFGIPASTNTGRFQYTGQVWVTELGMYYYKARFYSPNMGRFMQTDPIGYGDGMNWYAYVGNDPVNGRDPSGLNDCRDCYSLPPVTIYTPGNGSKQSGPSYGYSFSLSYGARRDFGGWSALQAIARNAPVNKSTVDSTPLQKPKYCTSTIYKIGDWINSGSDAVAYGALAADAAAVGTFVGSGGVATPGSGVLLGVGLSLHGTAGTIGTIGNVFKYLAGDQRSLSNLAIDGALNALPGAGLKNELAKMVLGKASDGVISDPCK